VIEAGFRARRQKIHAVTCGAPGVFILFREHDMKEFDELVRIMATLRGEGGCPWDHRQSHESLIPYLIEEAYETVEAVESGKTEHMCEELGDLMLQIVFHAQIAREKGEFDIAQVLDGINSKLVRRHPHVFGDSTVSTPDEVVKQWNEIKHEEKNGGRGGHEPPRETIARSLPTLARAAALQKLLAKKGIETGLLEENLQALEKASPGKEGPLQGRSREEKKEAIGQILFHLVALATRLGVDPEQSLRETIGKFEGLIERGLA
jgi:tetrapyrrole methylase family protein / MazG family protein